VQRWEFQRGEREAIVIDFITSERNGHRQKHPVESSKKVKITKASTNLHKNNQEDVGLMEMEPEIRTYMIALLELGIEHNEHGGLNEERLSKLERDQGLSHEKMKEAIKHLVERGALNPTFEDPKLRYGIIQAFVTDVGRMRYHQLVEETASKVKAPTSKKVFIVHGKDEENRELLKRVLIEWGLDPIILGEKPIKGKTLIERLEEHTAQVGFAFIIMTPDDIGMEKSSISKFIDAVADYWHEPSISSTVDTTGSGTARSYPTGLKQAIEKALPQHFKFRARQNILFEYGLCVGLLGREKVTETDCQDRIRQELKEFGYELKDQRVLWDGPSSVPLDEWDELAEVPDQLLPPELVAEKARLSENPRLISKVRVFRKTDGTFVIKWNEI